MSSINRIKQSRWHNRSLVVAEASFVMADLNPLISEPIRYGTLFAAQGLFDNIFLSGLAFGLITLLLDCSGAVAIADLFSQKSSAKIIRQSTSLIEKAGLARLLDTPTSKSVDFGITLIVGTPVTLLVKQHQDPKRTRGENIRQGLLLSFAASVVAALQGAAIVAGIWHPSPLTITVAVIVILGFLALNKYLKQKYRQYKLKSLT